MRAAVRPTTLDALTPVISWTKAPPGIGGRRRELVAFPRYTSLAAEPPRLDALRAKPDSAFPFASQLISFECTADGKTVAPPEKLFGLACTGYA